MAGIKQLVGQTAVYGLSSVVGRMLNYLMVPLYTYLLPTESYGIFTELYSYVALLLALLIYGMETTFFRFSETEKSAQRVVSTAIISLMASTSFFFVLAWGFKGAITHALGYESHPHYVQWFIFIVSFDVLSAIPFAYLRQQNKAARYVSLKLINIGVNLGLNLFFILLCPYIMAQGETHLLYHGIAWFFDGSDLVQYVFISNLIASLLSLLLLLPIFKHIRQGFDKAIWRKMLPYTWPILIVNVAGLVPISLDKILLPDLLPGTATYGMQQLGIYGANAKIAVIMTLFIQTFRYAADPFFFAKAKDKDAKQTYAHVMHWFVIVGSLVFLTTTMCIDVIQYFIGKDYRGGLEVVPILLIANLFLGIYYNLSFWYKLTQKTIYGAIFSTVGALTSVALIVLLVPHWGIYGAALSVMGGYLVPTLLSLFYGRRHYPVPYRMLPMVLYPLSVVLLYAGANWLQLPLLWRILIVAAYTAAAAYKEGLISYFLSAYKKR